MATRVREKTKARLENKDTRPYAVAKSIRISPYKVRSVLDVIRGKSYVEAVALLKAMNKSSSTPILKVVNSAAANAENNHSMDPEKLYVAEVFATPGPILKRIMPRAQGRAYRINKRTSHVTLAVAEKN